AGAPAAGYGSLGGRPRYRRPPIGASQAQPAASRRPSSRQANRRDDRRLAAAQSALHLGRASTQGFPAAVQLLRRRSVVRQPRRQRYSTSESNRAERADRSLGHAV